MDIRLSFQHQNLPDFNWKDYNALREAIRSNDKGMVLELVESGVKLNAPSPVQNLSPLHLAVISRCQEIVEILLGAGAEVGAKDLHSDTPLTLAAKIENRDLISILLSHDVNNNVNIEGLSHLHVACMTNDIKIIEKLLLDENYKNINSAVGKESVFWPSYTALHFAVHFGCIDTVEYLLKCGADLTAEDSRKLTPLHLADLQRNEKIIDLLLAAHKFEIKNPNGRMGMTHFHIACTRDDVSVVQNFLEAGVDINLRVSPYMNASYWSSWRPIDLAMYYGCSRVVNFLLRAHVELQTLFPTKLSNVYVEKNDTLYKSIVLQRSIFSEFSKNVNEMSEFHSHYIYYGFDISVEAVRKLISTDASRDLNAPIHMGSTLLHLAVKYKCDLTVKFLLDHGANVMIKNSKGETPIHIAFRNESSKIFRLMVEGLGSQSENVTNHEGLSIFHMLCTTDYLEAVKMFAQNANVNINAQVTSKSTCWSGFTAAHFACMFGQISTVDFLLELNADISITNGTNLSPLDLVVDNFFLSRFSEKNEAIKGLMMTMFHFNEFSHRSSLRLTPLHAMCINESTDLREMEQYILDHRDELSKLTNSPKSLRYHRCTPLHLSIIFRNFGQAKLLLENGADAFIVNYEGKTPLECLVSSTLSSSILKILSEAEFCFTLGTPMPGLKPSHFHIACAFGFINVVRCVLDNIPDKELKLTFVNCRDQDGRTPLHSVSLFMYIFVYPNTMSDVQESFEKSQTEIVRLLLETGADPNARDFELATPLHSAYQSRNVQVCKLLIIHGANVNAQTIYGKTPLHMNFPYADEKVGKITALLLYTGADINLIDEKGQTALSSKLDLDRYDENVDYVLKFVANIMLHIQKLQLIGRHVNKENLRAHSVFLGEHDVGSYLNEAASIEKCRRELGLMETVKIDHNTTLRDILTKHPNEMVFRCENEYLQNIVISKDFSLEYPRYGFLIRLQMKYGRIRRLLLLKSQKSLMNVIGIYLSEPCLETILQYLSNDDLKSIIMSGETVQEKP